MESLEGLTDGGVKIFRPGRNLRLLYLTYLLVTVWFLILPWLVPVVILAPPQAGLVAGLLVLAVVLFALVWIRKFHASLVYTFTPHDISWNRGVWWRQTSIVPYNRITNIDILQGPLMRRLGLTTMRIQTAGYSAPSGQISEMRIYGVDDPQGLENFLSERVKALAPAGVETGSSTGTAVPIRAEESWSKEVLRELVKIREILENGR
jgi:membrane protein YdbS with pleckstrin-like domain